MDFDRKRKVREQARASVVLGVYFCLGLIFGAWSFIRGVFFLDSRVVWYIHRVVGPDILISSNRVYEL